MLELMQQQPQVNKKQSPQQRNQQVIRVNSYRMKQKRNLVHQNFIRIIF
jgi:hypothetical protein